MSYANRLYDHLKSEEIGQKIKKMPKTKNVRRHPDMHGPGDPRSYKKSRADAGQIDFYHYGGKKSKETKYEEMWTGKGKDKSDSMRSDWKKVAKELGIDKVDSEDEVRQMIDYVMGSRSAKNDVVTEAKDVEPLPTQPIGDKPKEVQDAVKEYETSKLENPGNQQPRFSDIIKTDLVGNPTSDPNLDSVKHGDDLNEWYQKKFIPHLEAEAHATAHETGDTSRFLISNFAFDPPKLGDPKKLFDYYSDKIKSD